MKNIVRSITLLMILAVSHLLAQSEAIPLPTPPEGFSWQEVKEVNGYFLRPQGWYFKHEQSKGTQAYFITKEEIVDKSSRFDTGLSINVIQGIDKREHVAPSVYAQAFLEKLKDKFKVLNAFGSKHGKFQLFNLIYSSVRPDDKEVIVQNMVIANDTTGTIYLLIFEWLASDTRQIEPVRSAILNGFAIDDEY